MTCVTHGIAHSGKLTEDEARELKVMCTGWDLQPEGMIIFNGTLYRPGDVLPGALKVLVDSVVKNWEET